MEPCERKYAFSAGRARAAPASGLKKAAVPAGDGARVGRRLTEAHGVYDFQLRKADLGMIFAHFVLDVPVEEL